MSSTIIMPCAGQSSRFNTNKPKWMLTHPNGNLMLQESLFGLEFNNVSRIIITVVKDHIDIHKIKLNEISSDIAEVIGIVPEFLILDNFTSSQSDTVYQTIIKCNVQGAIFIKDCDNYFNASIVEDNSVCVSLLTENINAVNKSYVCLNKYGNISGIVEKQIISNKFCVGGYSFKEASDFISAFKEISNIKNINIKEIYISHIVQQMLLNGKSFESQSITNYIDWGTSKDWLNYIKEFKTIFVDLDGALVKNSGEYTDPCWGETNGLSINIDSINDCYNSNKCMIVITTSRKEKYKEITISQLERLGIKYHKIIFGLFHAQRILINDYSITNPYPSAIAVNIKRDANNLNDLI